MPELQTGAYSVCHTLLRKLYAVGAGSYGSNAPMSRNAHSRILTFVMRPFLT